MRTSVATEGNAPVPSGPAWLAKPTSTNLHAVDGCPPRSAGTGARSSAHGIASTLIGRRSDTCCHVGGHLTSCLSFCLIRSRLGPFTDVHPDRACAVRERWRTPVNAGQHCWKACWGQPLASSNLASSATSICDVIRPRACPAELRPTRPWPATRRTSPSARAGGRAVKEGLSRCSLCLVCHADVVQAAQVPPLW